MNMFTLLTIYRTSTKAAPIMSSRLAVRALESVAAVASVVAEAVTATGIAFPRLLRSGAVGSVMYVYTLTLTVFY